MWRRRRCKSAPKPSSGKKRIRRPNATLLAFLSHPVGRKCEIDKLEGFRISGSCSAVLTAPRRFDPGDFYLFHIHHGLKRALCFIAAGGHRLGQNTRRDLPRHAPLILAPAARALLAAIPDDGVPVAIGLGLILGG